MHRCADPSPSAEGQAHRGRGPDAADQIHHIQGHGSDPWWYSRSPFGNEIRNTDADPAGDAEGPDDLSAEGQDCRLLQDLDETVFSTNPAGGFAATTVWGYGAVASESKGGLLIRNAPSLTIEAKWNRPVRVQWINQLVDANGNYLPHLLPFDPTLHWANPPRGVMGRDMRPTFGSTPGPVHRSRADRHSRPRRCGGWR
jgi:hypothetical protein